MTPAELAEDAAQGCERIVSVRRGGGVRRFHTHRVVCDNTVAQHSWGVATLVDDLLAGCASAQLLRAALYHDVAEHVFGDIPSPAKKLMDTKALHKMEESYLRERNLASQLTPFEQLVLKLADILDGLWFCVEERERGNRSLESIYNTYHDYLQEKIGQFTSLEVVEKKAVNDVFKALGYHIALLGTSHQRGKIYVG